MCLCLCKWWCLCSCWRRCCCCCCRCCCCFGHNFHACVCPHTEDPAVQLPASAPPPKPSSSHTCELAEKLPAEPGTVMHTIGMSTLSKNCTCGISTGCSSSARQPKNTDSQHRERQTPRERNPTVTEFSPIIAHDPILTLTCIFASTNDQDNMVSALSKNWHGSPRTLTLNIESAKRHANVTQPSQNSPIIAHGPILTLTCIFASTNDQDDMVSALSKNWHGSPRTLTLNIHSAKQNCAEDRETPQK